MRIKITNPKHAWHRVYQNREYDVLMDDLTEAHHQYPVMTKAGRTWFDKDACTIID